MTVKELASIMGNQFIAVGRVNSDTISYSGRADKFKSWLEKREVVRVKVPTDEYSATIIWVK